MHFLRALFLVFLGGHAQTDKWANRILISNLQALGDLAVFTSVLKHYKRAFPNKTIYLLIKSGSGMEHLLKPFVDIVLTVSYGRFMKNPLYGAFFIRHLRRIGFRTVIEHDHAASNMAGKIIATSIQAQLVWGYHGFRLQFQKPLDNNMERTLRFVVRSLYPRFTTIIPSIDAEDPSNQPLRHVIEHYQALFRAVTQSTEADFATTLPISDRVATRAQRLLLECGLKKNAYIVINLGSSSVWKNWPVERFAEVSRIFNEHAIPVVLVGASNETYLAERFSELYAGRIHNFVGVLSVQETVALIDGALLVFTNDTAPVHFAIARRRPSLCVVGGGHFGNISFYGYRDINVWAYNETSCYRDNWRCTLSCAPPAVAPCIASVEASMVRAKAQKLLVYIEKERAYPQESFAISFLPSTHA